MYIFKISDIFTILKNTHLIRKRNRNSFSLSVSSFTCKENFFVIKNLSACEICYPLSSEHKHCFEHTKSP